MRTRCRLFAATIAFVAILKTLAVANDSRDPEEPSVDDILQKFIDATGGSDNLKKIRSFVFQGEKREVASGIRWEVIMIQSTQGYVRTEQLPLAGTFIEARKGEDYCWTFTTFDGFQVVEGKAKEAFVSATQLHPQLHWARNTNGIALVGEEFVNDRAAWILKFTAADGATTRRSFDKQTGLLVKERFSIRDEAFTTYYSEYRDIDGVKVAHKESTSRGDGQIEWILEYSEILTNEEGFESIFVPPPGIEKSFVFPAGVQASPAVKPRRYAPQPAVECKGYQDARIAKDD